MQIVQNAYVTNDLKSTCERFYKDFGIGPYILAEGLELRDHRHKGQASEPIVLDAAFAQSGDLNVEIIEIKSKGASAISDMFPSNGFGLHHVAYFCDDYVAERDRLTRLGYPVSSEFLIGDDLEISFVDTRKAFGHMIELYPRHPLLIDLYERVRTLGANWDGADLFSIW